MPKRFFMRYRVIGYTIADAFRPCPGWGCKSFWIDSDKIGTEDIKEVEAAAKLPESVPRGYEFFEVTEMEL